MISVRFICTVALGILFTANMAGCVVVVKPKQERTNDLLEDSLPKALKGDASARYLTGVGFVKGDYSGGLGVDFQTGFSMIISAADNGNVDAQIWLGNYFNFKQPNSDRDTARAIYWFERAAQKSDSSDRSSLSMLYGEKKSVHYDAVQSCKWILTQFRNPSHCSELDLTPPQLEEATNLAKLWITVHPKAKLYDW